MTRSVVVLLGRGSGDRLGPQVGRRAIRERSDDPDNGPEHGIEAGGTGNAAVSAASA
jgi:hypothetical protein